MKKWVGVFQVLLSGVGFGFLGIFGRWAFQQGLSIGELLFWRFVFAGAMLWAWWLFSRVVLGRKSSHASQRISFPQVLVSLLLGILGYAVFSTLYFEAIKGVSVALAAMLLFTFPIFVSLGSHFVLRERLRGPQWLSLFVACGGLVLLLWGDLSVDSSRALLAGIGAAVSYATYVLISGRVQRNVPPLASSRYVITGAALGLFAFHRPELARLVSFSEMQLLILVGLSMVCSIAPMSLFLAGLQKMKSSQASLLVMIEPVVAAVAAWLLLGEALSPRQLLGAALVVGALVMNSLVSRGR